MKVTKLQEAIEDLIQQIKNKNGAPAETELVIFSEDEEDKMVSIIVGLGCHVRPSDGARLAFIETNSPTPINKICDWNKHKTEIKQNIPIEDR